MQARRASEGMWACAVAYSFRNRVNSSIVMVVSSPSSRERPPLPRPFPTR